MEDEAGPESLGIAVERERTGDTHGIQTASCWDIERDVTACVIENPASAIPNVSPMLMYTAPNHCPGSRS